MLSHVLKEQYKALKPGGKIVIIVHDPSTFSSSCTELTEEFVIGSLW